MADNYLIISDTQEPYGAHKAIKFCQYVQKYFNIPKDNVYHVGDEVDQFHGGTYPKGADYEITPKGELLQAIEKMQMWYDAFPRCRVAISNHGIRWAKKAFLSDIPESLLRDYRDIIQAPAGWQWADRWIVKAKKQNFLVMHGMGYSSQVAHRQMAMDLGISVAHGHLHSGAGISYIVTNNQKIWGMNVGCLIDVESFAFKYGKHSRFKPCLGVGVVINGGTTPLWIPYDV